MRQGSLAVLSAICIGAWPTASQSEVIIAPVKVTTWQKRAIAIPPQRMVILDLGTLDAGEGVAVEVNVANAVYKDLSAYIVDAPNMALARQNVPFKAVQGVAKRVAPFGFKATVGVFGPYYVILDNRHAALIEKKVEYQVKFAKRLSPSEIKAKKEHFEKLYSVLKRMFVFKDFNIRIAPCGVSNAFSVLATGDVTICNELIDEMADRPGALAAVVFHELGHTLLNLWGHPNYKDEDVADQFATNILLRSGEHGKRALSEWMQWFAEHNPRSQASHMIERGDTHSLSIQRIRNIQSDLANAEDLLRRWNNVLYPNMTEGALRSIEARPAPFDSANLARLELARRGNASK